VMRRALRTTVEVAVPPPGPRAGRRPRLYRSLAGTVVAVAVVSAALMVAAVFAPWVDQGDGWGALDRADEVAYSGWIVLVAGLVGGLLAIIAVRSTVAAGCALTAGAIAAAAAFNVQDKAHGCAGRGGFTGGLGLLCLAPSGTWVLELATLASLSLLCAGAVALVLSVAWRLPDSPNGAAPRDLVWKRPQLSSLRAVARKYER
jgi:hypothetical protein